MSELTISNNGFSLGLGDAVNFDRGAGIPHISDQDLADLAPIDNSSSALSFAYCSGEGSSNDSHFASLAIDLSDNTSMGGASPQNFHGEGASFRPPEIQSISTAYGDLIG